VPLEQAHEFADFDSGVPDLDTWLLRRALPNQRTGASRTFVIVESGRVVGYYALASGGVAHNVALGKFRRNMPDPVPVIILARLAVDRSVQGQGLGKRLLRNAVLRVLAVSDEVGVRGMLVHAISEEAKRFYQRHGFIESPIEPMMLMATIADLKLAAS
jgi:GNAT superfamily N-acetyltransferase